MSIRRQAETLGKLVFGPMVTSYEKLHAALKEMNDAAERDLETLRAEVDRLESLAESDDSDRHP